MTPESLLKEFITWLTWERENRLYICEEGAGYDDVEFDPIDDQLAGYLPEEFLKYLKAKEK